MTRAFLWREEGPGRTLVLQSGPVFVRRGEAAVVLVTSGDRADALAAVLSRLLEQPDPEPAP